MGKVIVNLEKIPDIISDIKYTNNRLKDLLEAANEVLQEKKNANK